jgi:hypothetical protein
MDKEEIELKLLLDAQAYQALQKRTPGTDHQKVMRSSRSTITTILPNSSFTNAVVPYAGGSKMGKAI